MHGSLKTEIGRARKAWGRVAFDRKEHAVVEGKQVPPSVMLHELVTNRLQPPAGAGIIDTNSVCTNYWYSGPPRPLVHGGHIT